MKNAIVEKSFDFAKRIVNLKKYLNVEKREFSLADQILRSGTSIGANVVESQNARTNNEFVSKLCIAQAEANETMYWIKLLHETDYLDDRFFESLYSDCNELYKLLGSIILSSNSKN